MRTLLTLLLLLGSGAAWADTVATAREFYEAGRYTEAFELLEPALGSSASPSDLLLLTSICNRLEDWQCAVEHGKPAAKALASDSGAQFEYALALRHKLSNVSKVKALFMVDDYKEALARSLELDPNNLEAREEEIGYLTNAPSIGGGDKERARERVKELEALDWQRGMKMRAQLEGAEGNEAEVGRIFAQVTERHPEDHAARLRLGFWHQDQQQWRQADGQFAIVSENGNSRQRLDALYQRGRTRILGTYEAAEAVEMFERYVASVDDGLPVPSRSNARWRQGMAYEQLGQNAEAARAYREAVRLDPDNKDAKRALRGLD
jgi:tetratricopeptide (TPR) repeat protein